MSTQQDEPQLNERALHLFKTLVERYIRDGEPVGSRTLSRDSVLKLSPATVRNVMADLEECGLLRSPHTSAGRVPTNQGFRFFVDTLLRVEPLGGQARWRSARQVVASDDAALTPVLEFQDGLYVRLYRRGANAALLAARVEPDGVLEAIVGCRQADLPGARLAMFQFIRSLVR